jgi:hypothetical protein
MLSDLRRLTLWTGFFGAPVCLLFAAGCSYSPAVTAPSAAVAAGHAAYIGSAACADCHATEFREHQASRHNFTLRTLDASLPTGIAPPAGHVPDSDIVLRRKEGAYRISKAAQGSGDAPVQLVFGSGKTGLTLASVLSSGEMIEISRSYFPSKHVWYVTPGHETRPNGEIGLRCTAEEAGHCMRCHSVTYSATAPQPERRFMGVGCEACHGPGGAHVQAMRSGDKELHLARPSTLGGAASVQICAVCHRGKEAVNLNSVQAHMTNRFQAYGLTQSRCFLESQDKLSCVTCHNPHTDADTDAAHYVNKCLGCHSGAPPTRTTAQGRICPVNRREGCIGCHMPPQPVFKSSALPVYMAEHFIRVYRDPRHPRR